MDDPQAEIVAFLSDPAAYHEPGASIERIDTHISRVFLVGERAWKLKRAVRLSYLDFSTMERRRRACAAELALNRRTAPELYLERRAVRRRDDGSLTLFEDGPAADWLVVMRRFPQEALFDRLAVAGRLTLELMRDLADRIADFHCGLSPDYRFGGARGIAAVIRSNGRAFAALPEGCLDREAVGFLQRRSRAALDKVRTLLDERRAAGWVRRCHGDLHLRNICLFDGRPVLFDCLEFDRALATIDIAYDVAFLLMDLEQRGARDLASLVFNRWLDMTGDAACLAAVPLFLSLRAAVRAHVTALGGAAADARSYLALAAHCLESKVPCLVAIGGASGSGKSTLGAALAPELSPGPGARLLRSDVIRKRLRGALPETRLPPDAYDEATDQRVYESLRAGARAALAAGRSVVVDAVHARAEERGAIARVAEAAGVPFTGLWLDASHEILGARLAARRGDASDATIAIAEAQLARGFGEVGWRRIDAGRGRASALAEARRVIGPG